MTRRAFVMLLLGTGLLGLVGFWLFRRIGLLGFNIADLQSRRELIAELTETVIPETDSPGAKAVDVASYIIRTVGGGETRREQHAFVRGLDNVELFCQRKYRKSFVACSVSQRSAVLTHFETKELSRFPMVNKINRKLFGRPFIIQLKELTVEGYCTSQVGATQGLAYDFIPRCFQACIPLHTDQPGWALN